MTRALAIDFGTSFTTAAVRRNGDAEVLKFGRSEAVADRMPSLVMLAESGSLLVGWQAEREAELAPERVERTPKQVLEPGRVLDLGEPVWAVDAVARILELPYREAVAQAGGEFDEVWLTHPASWRSARRDALLDAAMRAGIAKAQMTPEPVAAARWLARESDQVPVGGHVAVYDLGGGTFDTAVLMRTGDGFELAGPPGGQMGLGGETFDEKLLAFVRDLLAEDSPEDLEAIDSHPRSRAALRREVRRVKEDLSSAPAAMVLLPSPAERQTVHLSVDDLNGLIEEDIERSVEILENTIAESSSVLPELAAIYLAGGSSRIKLVSNTIGKRTGRVPQTLRDPKTAVVLGATGTQAAAPKARPKPQPKPKPKPQSAPKAVPTPKPEPKPEPIAVRPYKPPPDPGAIWRAIGIACFIGSFVVLFGMSFAGVQDGSPSPYVIVLLGGWGLGGVFMVISLLVRSKGESR